MADKPKSEEQRRDDVLRRMLATPPKPFTEKKSDAKPAAERKSAGKRAKKGR